VKVRGLVDALMLFVGRGGMALGYWIEQVDSMVACDGIKTSGFGVFFGWTLDVQFDFLFTLLMLHSNF